MVQEVGKPAWKQIVKKEKADMEKKYEEMFKKDAMPFNVVFMLMENMAKEVATFFPDWQRQDRTDYMAILYSNPLIAMRHADLAELFKPENFAKIGKCLDMWKHTTAWDADSQKELPAVIMAKLLWNVLERNNETEEGGPWLVGLADKAVKAFDEDTPVCALCNAYGKVVKMCKNGISMDRRQLAMTFFDVYPDGQARDEDIKAEGVLPWLMPWIEGLAEWKILPDGTASPSRCRNWLADSKAFFALLKKHLEAWMELDTLKGADDEAYRMKLSQYRRGSTVGNPHSGEKNVPMFQEFGESLAKDGSMVVTAELASVAKYYAVTTRGWMMRFLAKPVVASKGKMFPSLENPTRYYDEPKPPTRYVAFENMRVERYADIGVKLGFLNPDTLEIKTNPLTGKPYRASDYDDGLLDASIIRTVLKDTSNDIVKEPKYTRIIEEN